VKFCEGTIVQSLKAILYDLDGTIADTDPIHFIAWQDCLKEFGIEITETFYKQEMSGSTNPRLIAKFLPQLSASEGEALSEQKEARFRALVQQLPLMPGLMDLIDWAKQRHIQQAVVTNAPRKNAQFMLKALQLDDVFDRVILAEEVGIGKPDPAPYTYALKQFGLEPDQAIAFEDSPLGIQSATNAGILTIGIASTQTPEDLKHMGTTLAIQDFTDPELWALLD
jgi:HAD superfamily hydrolase (TIGR01509 family)